MPGTTHDDEEIESEATQKNPDDDVELDYGGQEMPGTAHDDEEEEARDDEETESDGDGDDDGDDDDDV